MGGYSGQALREWCKEYRRRKRARGECYECSDLAEPFHTLCDYHLRRRRERWHEAKPADLQRCAG